MKRGTYNLIFLLVIFFTVVFVRPVLAAEEKLSLTITPPLFQLSIGQGEIWKSSLKVVNTNPYDLTVYASVMDFAAMGEEGKSRMIPIVGMGAENYTISLAQWIEVPVEPVVIAGESSVEIPFSINIPSNAEPGGHYAAILIGTFPLMEKSNGPIIQISSQISSLLFLRVKGEVEENGNIREFRAEKSFYQEPPVNFILRFANTGNVHLRPVGDIVVYDMWGREREKMAVNQDSNFGNILPGSVRKFLFEWEGEISFFEVGRYKAVMTLSFGEGGYQSVTATAYFWILPLKSFLAIGLSIILIILFTALAIRAYIRKSLSAFKR